MAIQVHYQNVNFQLKNSGKVKNWLAKVIAREQKRCGLIRYFFIDDLSLRDINREFIEHDYFTDVITFDYSKKNVIEGEIYISVDRVKINAKQFGCSVRSEILRVMVHGLLHMLNYNDVKSTERIRMREKENFYLELLKSEF